MFQSSADLEIESFEDKQAICKRRLVEKTCTIQFRLFSDHVAVRLKTLKPTLQYSVRKIARDLPLSKSIDRCFKTETLKENTSKIAVHVQIRDARISLSLSPLPSRSLSLSLSLSHTHTHTH